MISDDERREVAERLRVYSHDFDFGDSNPFWYVSKAAFGDVDVHTYYSVFARLADLIDRTTCQNKQIIYNRTAPIEFRTDNFTCSACGETFCADGDGVNHPIDWAFCPNCGAEVVSADD